MGPFDELFDFDRDEEVDRAEFAVGMELWDELNNEDDEDDDEDDEEDEEDEEQELINELEETGLDYYDLLDMSPEERNVALEEEGLDPDDFSEIFDDWDEEDLGG